MMKVNRGLLWLALITLSFHAISSSPIKHIIVLMEENRSFDHMFGWYPGVNGLKGNECNYVEVTDANSTKVCVDQTSPWVAPCDPDHSTPATSFKIFGPTAVNQSDFTNPVMSGFVEWENRRGNNRTNYCDVMSMLTPQHLPIISTLASEFLLFDRFFAAHPGPTWPNRMFTLSGTSAGSTETNAWYHDIVGQLYPQETFYDQLSKEGMQWRHYFNDTPWELFMSSLAHNPEHVVPMDQFYEDARTGNLPAFGWINPRSGFNISLNQGSNDQHPDHDMALGEAFMKDVYEALRASPAWHETLFIITYDEHGGYYDHVPTPVAGVPPPGDGETSYPDQNFMFDRLGVRIPTLLISPWIPKGVVLSSPPLKQKPTQYSEYTLTSIVATARKLLGLSSAPLTKREAWSATFEQAFNLSSPRTDCPLHLPSPPAPAINYDAKQEMLMPVNDLQKHLMSVHANILGEKYPTHIKEQGQVSEWLQNKFFEHKERTIAWKKSKQTPTLSPLPHSSSVSPPVDLQTNTTIYLVLRVSANTAWISSSWVLNRADGVDYITISNRNSTPAYCVDYDTVGLEGDDIPVTISNCYPTPNPAFNRDKGQQWVWRGDATVRPFARQDLCLSANVLESGNTKLSVKLCSQVSAEKYWTWHYDAGGDVDYSSGGIQFAAWTLGLVNSTYTGNSTTPGQPVHKRSLLDEGTPIAI